MLRIHKQILTGNAPIVTFMLGALLAVLVVLSPGVAQASIPTDPGGSSGSSSAVVTCPDGKTQVPAGSESSCPAPVDPASAGGNCWSLSNCDIIHDYINPAINFLAAGVGVAVVISIIVGGIQYGSSAGDSQKVTAAKARIRNAIIALVAFALLYAMLNFLIPGGLTSSL